MHASLEMPSLCVELDDDDCDSIEPDALSFAIPVGKLFLSIKKKMSSSHYDH